MKKILDYIYKVGFFEPLQYLGSYNNLPFTHEEYTQYTSDLYAKLSPHASVSCEFPIKIVVCYFEEKKEGFILRFCRYGEHVYQLMTERYYHENFHGDKSLSFTKP